MGRREEKPTRGKMAKDGERVLVYARKHAHLLGEREAKTCMPRSWPTLDFHATGGRQERGIKDYL